MISPFPLRGDRLDILKRYFLSLAKAIEVKIFRKLFDPGPEVLDDRCMGCYLFPRFEHCLRKQVLCLRGVAEILEAVAIKLILITNPLRPKW